MADDKVNFDNNTPAILDASKIRSLMGIDAETGLVGNVMFLDIVNEAGKRTGEAVKVTGNSLPTMGVANKRYSVTVGSAGLTLTYTHPDTEVVTEFVFAANTQGTVFWDGIAETWTKESEVTLPVQDISPIEPIVENVRVDASGNMYFLDAEKNAGLILTSEGVLRVFRIELAGELLDLSKFALRTSLENLADNFEIDENGTFYIHDENGNLSFRISSSGEVEFYQNAENFASNFNRAKGMLDISNDQDDFSFTSPTHVFGVYGDNRQYFSELYPEGLISARLPVLLDEQKKVILQNTGSQIEKVVAADKAFTIGGNGFLKKTLETVYIRSNRTSLQSRNVNLMILGDSIARQNSTTGNIKGTIANHVKQFANMDNVDIGNIDVNMVGVMDAVTISTSYNGSAITNRSCSEGRSGWATYNYLNYPKWVRLDGTAFEDAYTFLGAEAMYYLAGLATKTPFDSTVAGQPYEAYSTSKNFTVCDTPVGRYKPDYNSALWSSLKAKWGFTTVALAYDSSTEDAKMSEFLFGTGGVENCNGGVCFAPKINDNPFYSIEKAQAYTGDHDWVFDNAFSIAKYIERYRTMDDSGNRLVLGNGTGSLVTDVNSYDVCMPTHFAEGLGTNDAVLGADNMFYFTSVLLRSVNGELPDCKIGKYIPRRPGVFYPQRWQEYGLSNQLSIQSTMYRFNALLLEGLGTADLTKDINYITTYATQSPISAGYSDFLTYDLNDVEMNPKITSGSDSVHLSAVQLRSIAYHIYSWLVWSVN
ncbi:hypothetical protein [Sphingobacterium sp. LRF_L2]|uniref:hypothetical protein n=1 Tax=Sphingobacterium sp. LRF_L2 TaxID=3369421 RepID=UPI003F641621